MKKIKLLLVDSRHYTAGVHSAYVPVGLGYIGTYMLKMNEPQSFDMKISVHPDEIFDLLDDWQPDIFAASNYIWNANLSYRMCEYAKSKSKDVLCVLGGPEFPSGSGLQNLTETINKNCFEYLKRRTHIDYYCYNDGEPAFAKVIQEYIKNGFSAKKMREKNLIVDGSMSLSNDNKKLLCGKPVSRLGVGNKIDGLDTIPSPYLTGLLDKYLNGNFVPAFETARGCPFLCTFCDTGLDRNKIVSFGTKRMVEELNYVSERVTKFSGNKSIAFFDSNWGMYEKDVVLSDHILKIINEKDWPSSIEITTAKNRKQQVLDIDQKLKNRVHITLSQQSMNRDTLKLIKRDNMTNDKYIKFMKELENRGKNSICELIIPLPNETKQTYLDNVRLLMEYRVNVATYTLMLLCGAELGREDEIEKYKMKYKWRIIPRDFGTYRGKKIIEPERVCVDTNTMPYNDFIECRKFSLLIEFYSYAIFHPFKRLLNTDLKLSFFEFLRLVFEKLEKNNSKVPKELQKVWNEFSNEAEGELFDTEEQIYEFYSKEENYKKLLTAELGDNLLRKYSAKLVSRALNDVFDFSINLINEMIPKENENKEEIQDALESSRLWFRNLYILDAIFDWERAKKNEAIVKLKYDLPKWYLDKDKNILNFKKKIDYKMTFNKKNEEVKNELIATYGDKDKVFTIGKYFHKRAMQDEIVKSSVEI